MADKFGLGISLFKLINLPVCESNLRYEQWYDFILSQKAEARSDANEKLVWILPASSSLSQGPWRSYQCNHILHPDSMQWSLFCFYLKSRHFASFCYYLPLWLSRWRSHRSYKDNFKLENNLKSIFVCSFIHFLSVIFAYIFTYIQVDF